MHHVEHLRRYLPNTMIAEVSLMRYVIDSSPDPHFSQCGQAKTNSMHKWATFANNSGRGKVIFAMLVKSFDNHLTEYNINYIDIISITSMIYDITLSS